MLPPAVMGGWWRCPCWPMTTMARGTRCRRARRDWRPAAGEGAGKRPPARACLAIVRARRRRAARTPWLVSARLARASWAAHEGGEVARDRVACSWWPRVLEWHCARCALAASADRLAAPSRGAAGRGARGAQARVLSAAAASSVRRRRWGPCERGRAGPQRSDGAARRSADDICKALIVAERCACETSRRAPPLLLETGSNSQ
eukprot:scaffold1954_cov364-Prasinococcus_capsulatus_cf.AAC.1